jgi:flavin-dependent dehydrogenase
VTARALGLVADAVDPAGIPGVRIRAARFWHGGRSVDVPLDPAHGGLVVASRTTFDGLLLDAAVRAGAVHLRHRVVDVAGAEGRWRLRTTNGPAIQAAHIIAADGANSLIRRRLVRAFDRRQLSIATGFFAHGQTSDVIDIEFTENPAGYLWNFPRPDHLAIGLCAQADTGVTPEALRTRARAWMRGHQLDDAALTRYAWPIPSLSAADVDRLPVAGPGWSLVGDAAGLVDPITREGIFFALQSATFAAEAIASARAPHATYTERARAEIMSELTRAARLKAGFFRPRFIRHLVDALDENPRIRAVMADLVAGVQGYRGLRRRLGATLDIRLAGRVLVDLLQGA